MVKTIPRVELPDARRLTPLEMNNYHFRTPDSHTPSGPAPAQPQPAPDSPKK